MKQLMLLIAVLTVGVATYFGNDFMNTSETSLLMQNVEALAAGEDIAVRVDCDGNGGIYCPLNNKAAYSSVRYQQL